MIIFHFEGMSFSSAHDLKQWDFLDNNEIFSEFAQFIRIFEISVLTMFYHAVSFPMLGTDITEHKILFLVIFKP